MLHLKAAASRWLVHKCRQTQFAVCLGDAVLLVSSLLIVVLLSEVAPSPNLSQCPDIILSVLELKKTPSLVPKLFWVDCSLTAVHAHLK